MSGAYGRRLAFKNFPAGCIHPFAMSAGAHPSEAVPQRHTRQIVSLEVRCVATLVRNPHKIGNMADLPEAAVALLLRGLAANWKLTPVLVERFVHSGHPAVLDIIQEMNLDVAAGIYVLVDAPPPRQIGDYSKDKG